MTEALITMAIPGAGKTTFVEERYKESFYYHCSADKFFINLDGVYEFNPSLLGKAHGQCLKDFIAGCSSATAPVVCDNTNTTIAEVAPYIAVAQAYEMNIKVVHFDCPPEIAAKRNQHGVPEEHVKRMHNRLQGTLSNWPRHWPKIETVKTY